MAVKKTDETNLSEDLLQVLEILPLQMVLVDAEGRILYTNRVLTSQSIEEVLNTYVIDHLPEKDKEEFRVHFDEVIKTGNVRYIETSLITFDWAQKWFKYYLAPVKKSGKVMQVVIIAEDITERKKAEQALRESEEKFRSLAEQSPNMIFINKKGRVVYANKQCEEIMGYAREEFYAPDFGFLSLIAPESQALIRQNFTRHMEDEEISPYEYTLVTAQGKKIEAIITTKLLSFENDTAILGIVTDITERRKAEDALKKAHDTLDRRVKTRTAELTQTNLKMQLEIEERTKAEQALKSREAMLRSIFESSPDAINVLNLSGTIIDCNQAAAEQAGFDSKDQLINRSAFDQVAPSDRARAQAIIERTVQQGSVRNQEFWVISKDGGYFPSELSTAVIKDPRGEIVGFLVVGKDITERKAQEDALIQSQALLQEQKKALEQKNIAMGEIIARVEVDKQKIKDDIALNVQRVLFPILDKWDQQDDSRTIIDVLRHHLTELTSPYGSQITEKTAHLTPREIEICNMIKAGLPSRDISQLLKISTATVERHRKNIRKKLNLTNQAVNLATFLRSLH
jgi:PAS domain S-box-containing protein